MRFCRQSSLIRACGTSSARFPSQIRALVFLAAVGLLTTPTITKSLPAGSSQKKEKKAPALRWDPPRVDARVKPLSATPPCSLPDVLNQAGQRAEELFDHLQNFIAHEQVRYEQMDSPTAFGPSAVSRTPQIPNRPTAVSFTGKFDYVVDFGKESPPLDVRETRTALPGTDSGNLGAIPDKGLPILALIFDPTMQSDYEMSCEGSTQWNNQTAWVVHFRQVKGRVPRTVTVEAAAESHRSKPGTTEVRPLSIKGRAWIAADSGQVMHLETNLLERIPTIALEENAFSVDYAPIKFQTKNVEVWLPQFAVAYIDYANRRMIVEHTFSDFQLFSVQTQDVIQKPKEP